MNQSAISPPDLSTQPFVTERLQLAVFLHATGLLALEHCELSQTGKVRFVFTDPRQVGDRTELAFDTGATVSATALFASQKYLRRKINELINHKRSINDTEFAIIEPTQSPSR
jgi:hypothetical protein